MRMNHRHTVVNCLLSHIFVHVDVYSVFIGMEMARYLSTYVPFKGQILLASYDDMTAKYVVFKSCLI